MKKFLIALLITVFFAGTVLAGSHSISLTKDEEEALKEMWQSTDLRLTIQTNMKVIAKNYLSRKIDEKWRRKTYEEKEQLIPTVTP